MSILSFIIPEHPSATYLLSCSVGIVLLTYWTKNYIERINYFKRMNLPSPIPLPLVGNFLSIARNGLLLSDMKIVRKYGKTCGYFEGASPVVFTIDVKLIKAILIKDFASFVNRRGFEAFVFEPMDKFITILKDDEWKNVRTIVTTSFTSGKLKLMSKSMLKSIKNYDNFLNQLTNTDSLLETKKFFGSYSLDTICSCCFGIDSDSLNDPDNEFIKNLQVIFRTGLSGNVKFILIFLVPKLAAFLARNNLIEFFPSKPLRFLENVTNEIISRRKANLDVRDDFIQSMVEHEKNLTEEDSSASNESGYLRKSLTNKEILAQSILFLAAGYETTATTLEFISYNLATHQSVQDKLIDEVDQVLKKHNEEVSYDSIMDMKYLDAVIDETLRLFPPGNRLDRTANKDFEFEGIKFKKGDVITVPIYALHHDPDLYPDPEEFIPERFGEESKRSRENVAFLGFGTGPRNCIGMRFALIEIKLIIASILAKYRFMPCDKTPEKIVLDKSGLTRSAKPIFLKVQKRVA